MGETKRRKSDAIFTLAENLLERNRALEEALRRILKLEWIMSRSWGSRENWEEREKAIADGRSLLSQSVSTPETK